MAKKRITIVIEETQENSGNYWFIIYKGKPNETTPEVQLLRNEEKTEKNLKKWTDYIANKIGSIIY